MLAKPKFTGTREKFDVIYIVHFVIRFPLFLIVGVICKRILHVIEQDISNETRQWPRQVILNTRVVVVTNIVKQSKTPTANQMEHDVLTREYISQAFCVIEK